MNIRLATNAEGPRIGEIMKGMGWGIDLDWSVVEPNWIVAEDEGGIIACLQVCPGVPMGSLDRLGYDQDVHHVTRAKAIHGMLTQGMESLKLCGAQLSVSIVDHELKGYKKILKKRGAETINHGAIIARRL